MQRLLSVQHWLGFAGFLAFLATGLYMRQLGAALSDGDQGVRLMYRSTHIYVLFSSLLNMLVGRLPPAPAAGRAISWLEAIARALLLASSPGLVTAFFIEPEAYAISRPITFWCVVACVVSILILSVAHSPWLQARLQHSTR